MTSLWPSWVRVSDGNGLKFSSIKSLLSSLISNHFISLVNIRHTGEIT